MRLVLVSLFALLILAGCSNTPDTSSPIKQAEKIKQEMQESVKDEMKKKISQPKYGISNTVPNFFAISPEIFQEFYDTKQFVVIDVRTPQEIAQGKIFDDALEIDFYANTFQEKISQLDKNKKYLLYCRSGSRSGKTLKMMKKLGFSEVYDLSGGNNAWMQYSAQLETDAVKKIPATGKE